MINNVNETPSTMEPIALTSGVMPLRMEEKT